MLNLRRATAANAQEIAELFTEIGYIPGYYRGVETAIRMSRSISRRARRSDGRVKKNGEL